MSPAALSKPDIEVLEDFLIENPDLERLEFLLSEFNWFEAAGVVRQELRHSDFLGFLLDPHQPHGLGDSFLTLLLRKVVQNSDLDRLPISAIDVTLWDLADTEVRREWRNIDILVLNRSQKFVILVENKVDSSEHSDQLTRYRKIALREFDGWKIGGIYLTPDGDDPSNPNFIACSYGVVHDALQTLLTSRTSIGEDVRTSIRHYAQLLQRHVLSDSEIADLCQRIYRRHQRALDLIFEHRPDRLALTQGFLKEILSDAPEVELDHCSKSYVRFIPTEWDIPTVRRGQGWTPSGRILLFEFKTDNRGIILVLHLGPGPIGVRDHLFGAAMRLAEFSPSSPSLNKKWNALAPAAVVVSKADLEEMDEEALQSKVHGFWRRFSSETLPGMVAALRPAIDELPARDA